jgi:rhodanese-related sulfurtransferase
MNQFFDPTIEMDPREVNRRMTEDDMLLIDVREDYEWEAGHVPGSRHVQLMQIAEEAAALPEKEAIAFICLSGVRSGMVATSFRRAGFEAYNVSGGFAAWFETGLPTEPEGAVVAGH